MAMTREKIRQAVETEFLGLLKDVYGEELVSVVLYGSVVKDTFTPGVSDVNVLVIAGQGEQSAFRRLGSSGHRLMRRLRITPLVLSREEFVTSSDVFPMEYMDMAESHETLFGPDVTTELHLSPVNLRHQIEHQVRGSLVSLRQLAIAAGRSRLFRNRLLRRELEQWYGSLASILRGLLRLKGVAVPSGPDALVEQVNRSLGLEPGPILQLLRCREGGCPDSLELIDSLLDRLTKLVRIVDELDAEGAR